MFQKLFTPAIILLNRLDYTRKLMLLWVLSMLSIAIVAYSLFVSLDRTIKPSQLQLEGLTLIEPMIPTIQAIQLHRGISVALLSGNEAMRDRRTEQEAKVAAAFRNLQERLPDNLDSNGNFQNIRTDWERTRQEGLKQTASGNFAAHTHLIEQLQTFGVSVADRYLLTLDPEIATSYLIDTFLNKLPDTLEHLGRIRAFGTIILADKQISEEQKDYLNAQIGGLESSLKALRHNFDKVGRGDAAVKDSLHTIPDDITRSAQRIIGLVNADLLTGRFTSDPDAFLDIATAEIDNSYKLLQESLIPTVRTLIQARIAQAVRTLYLNVGLALLGFLLVVYLAVSLYYATVSNIRALVSAARAFADGDLSVRLNLDTRDELRWAADSFNAMAEGFNAMLRARHEDETRLCATIETAMDAVVQMNADDIIIGWNPQAEKIFGWTREEALGRSLSKTIIPSQHREAHLRGLKCFLLTGEGKIMNTRIEMLGLHRNGHEFPVELSVTAISTTGRQEFSGFIRDISLQKESETVIWHQANFDPLTGLPNRHMFHDRLTQEVKKALRAGQKTALLFLDLDRFKEVNDTLGHSLGDRLLQEAAIRITACVRETDTVARLGGDEFTVILTEIDDLCAIGRVADNILDVLAQPFKLNGDVAYVSASIGITLYPDDGGQAETLLKHADQAMYAAKSKGRNRFEYFTPSMQASAQARLQMTNELRDALAAQQLMIHYQPVMDLATGRIVKAEALIRWQHPTLGLVSPAQFIPLAEETGMIVEIGDWVFREAVRQLKHWEALCDADFQISVNVSPVQFRRINPGQEWRTWLQELGLTGRSMVIEITEGLLLEAETDITEKLLEFKDAGIQVAIDDFGTGYSSLSYLKKFNIDYLKIDQSFVRDLETDPNDMALSEAIIVMAHKLGLKVIAEGVETDEQRQILAATGCDYAQGYLFSRPVPPEEFELLLRS